MKKNIAIIGGGISGLSTAHLLQEKGYKVSLFEANDKPGGLIKCRLHNNALYHTVGGHVFNSKRADVLNRFWKYFSQEKEFTKATRHAVASLDKMVDYPIENHLYQLDDPTTHLVIQELTEIEKSQSLPPSNFEQFLQQRFGMTLYNLYFKPYNEKIWKKSLANVPLSWLEGKLPMPTFQEIIFNNIMREKELNMVHSTFFYPRKGGSQFLADRLAEGIDIQYETEVTQLRKQGEQWIVNDKWAADQIIFCGNIVSLPSIAKELFDDTDRDKLSSLEYHGTTSVLCSIECNPYSWIYLPNPDYPAHRIIMTGNFSIHNNGDYQKTCTVEFTDLVDKKTILETLSQLPIKAEYLTHQYTQYTYPIQSATTRDIIHSIRGKLFQSNIHLIGRFAEWEYYNMDAAMGAAMDYVHINF